MYEFILILHMTCCHLAQRRRRGLSSKPPLSLSPSLSLSPLCCFLIKNCIINQSTYDTSPLSLSLSLSLKILPKPPLSICVVFLLRIVLEINQNMIQAPPLSLYLSLSFHLCCFLIMNCIIPLSPSVLFSY